MCIASLIKIAPDRRMSRFYEIHLAPTLFGDWTVVREWGRIGSPGRVRVDWYSTEEGAHTAGLRLRHQKVRSGYRPSDWSAA
jgi:predicted DNA-binding WGR domain protein